MTIPLRALLLDLERRSESLRDRVKSVSSDAERSNHLIAAYRTFETVRREAAALRTDPGLGDPALHTNQLQLFRRLSERAAIAEWHLIPILERFTEPDRTLTRICGRLCTEAAIAPPRPLVGALSTEYYWTTAGSAAIYAPAHEERSLLGLPDLGHEVGHVLLQIDEAGFLATFLDKLEAHIAHLRRRAQLDQRALGYVELYDRLFAQWRDDWWREFACDAIGTFMVGPAYGWQHLRLTAAHTADVFSPSLGEEATHPADDARFRVILFALERLGAADAAAELRTAWDDFVSITDERPDAEYVLCYPDSLLKELAAVTLEGADAKGMRPWTNQDESSIAAILNRAWVRFRADPEGYSAWEAAVLQKLP